MNQRLTELEARVASLERALEAQAIMCGRLFAMKPESNEWLGALRNAARSDPASIDPATYWSISGLLYGSCLQVLPVPEELKLPE